MYLYMASTEYYLKLHLVKLGMSEDLYGRRSTYRTGCPPGLTPSHDIDYVGVWKTDAIDRDDLYSYEDQLHNRFIKYRMMREMPGDSEWFEFKSDPIQLIKEFMATMPWAKEVPIDQIYELKRSPQIYLKKHYQKNTRFIRNSHKRISTLETIQHPVICVIQEFVKNDTLAGQIIAPCGSGKTIMACKGINGIMKVVICCPSNQIQKQWRDSLLNILEPMFNPEQIMLIGTYGTTNMDMIRDMMQRECYCIITTYMSSDLLLPLISYTQLFILDEAHHLGGIVGEDIGKTRQLMKKATDLNIKRLSLTFTPRFILNDDQEHLSMDDTETFGPVLYELRLRDLINKGVLPDYRLWTMRDESGENTGIIGKANMLLKAWNSKETHRGEEKYILHHLVVFAYTNNDAKEIYTYLSEHTSDLILCVKGGDNLEEAIQSYSNAPRAIFINCKVLGEGVDIPITNGVAVTYPKFAQGEITQMILRAGRWYPDKSIFHILLPVLDKEDMSGFEHVMTALASCDEQLCDEILIRASKKSKSDSTIIHELPESVSELVIIENYDGSDIDEIRKCFDSVRRGMYSSTKRIRQLCLDTGMDTSVDYKTDLRVQFPDLPENPTQGQSWYDYLHPSSKERIPLQQFTKMLEEHNLRKAQDYDIWLGVQLSPLRQSLPNTQHINDGYFGTVTNFNDVVEKFVTKIYKRR
jgi:superfamily II DNA or RNA helicase